MTTETNDADWKWDGKVINGFAKFNRLVKQDCTMRRLTSALEEPPGDPEPPGPTAFILLGILQDYTQHKLSIRNYLKVAKKISSKLSQ